MQIVHILRPPENYRQSIRRRAEPDSRIGAFDRLASGVELWIEPESGRVRRYVVQLENWQPPERVDGDLVGEATFELPDDLVLGYHILHARAGTASSTMPLIVTPGHVAHARGAS